MTASASPAPRGLSPEARTAAYYSTLFMGAALANVYAGVWMAGKGLSPDQIGAVNAAPLAIMLVLNWLVGRLADRASDWRATIVWGAVLGAVLPLGFLVADGFWSILVVWTLAGLPLAATVPVLDAAAMRMTARRGTAFGSLRAWGTAGYLVVLLGAGWIMEELGPGGFAPLMVVLAGVRALAALGLPRFRAPQGEALSSGARRLHEVMRPWFLLPLLGWSAVNATHLVLNAFQGLLWQAQGFGLGTIGLLIALGAASEALVFFAYGRLFRRVPARTLILASAVLSVARWALMAQAPDLPVAVLLQAMHGVTYAMGFLACIQFIADSTSEDIAAEAQGFFVVMQQAMSVATMAGFGLLMDRWGVGAHYGSALFAGLGALAIWASWHRRAP